MQQYRHEDVGLQKAVPTDGQISEDVHEYVLQENEEFRFEVAFGSKVQIQVRTAIYWLTNLVTIRNGRDFWIRISNRTGLQLCRYKGCHLHLSWGDSLRARRPVRRIYRRRDADDILCQSSFCP
jgi:hypothetical protein